VIDTDGFLQERLYAATTLNLNTMRDIAKGHEALRKGRYSVAGASYFLTICIEDQQTGLTDMPVSEKVLAAAKEACCGWEVRTVVVMPDHVHLLVELHSDQTLSHAFRLLKGRTSVVLRQVGLKWQRGYYDHKLRSTDDVFPIFLYIYLNPYRAELLSSGRMWPCYYCAADDWAWFGLLTKQACPYPEWLE